MIANELSWRPSTTANIVKVKADRDIDNFIFIKLNSLQVSPIFLNNLNPILMNKYLDYSQKIATYLITLR